METRVRDGRAKAVQVGGVGSEVGGGQDGLESVRYANNYLDGSEDG